MTTGDGDDEAKRLCAGRKESAINVAALMRRALMMRARRRTFFAWHWHWTSRTVHRQPSHLGTNVIARTMQCQNTVQNHLKVFLRILANLYWIFELSA